MIEYTPYILSVQNLGFSLRKIRELVFCVNGKIVRTTLSGSHRLNLAVCRQNLINIGCLV